MGNYVIRQYAFDDAVLWPLVGPFLCSRKVLSELGGPVYADRNSIWWVASCGVNVLAGFAILRKGRDAWHRDYGFVLPEHRGRGLHGFMIAAMDIHAGSNAALPIRVLVHKSRLRHYLKWNTIQIKGSWHTLENCPWT
jgi:GNAT superfamily N-acetyltransferase